MSFDTGVRIGKYEVVRKLGQGGYGVLYTARDTELDRDIAIKFLRPEHVFRPQVVQRFLQEARAAARINHPGIITVYDTGIVEGTNTRADGTVYIAMELLSGETLSNRIKRIGPMPSGIAIGIAHQLASALVAAHQANIIHRDLKPQNVFLVPDAAIIGGERVKILDFGIAKLTDGFGSNVQTNSMIMLGTPMYMSPEQCKSSGKVDARTDIYSLGCMLFQLVCGKPPFEGDSGELIAKHQLIAPPTPRSIVSELPESLDSLVNSMLAKSPDDRPQTMAAVLDGLEACAPKRTPVPQPMAELVAADASALTTQTTLSEAASSIGMRKRAQGLLQGRGAIIAGAAGAIVVGIIVGLTAAGGGDNDVAASAAIQQDAAMAIVQAVSEPPAAEPPPPVVEPPPTATPDAAVELTEPGLEEVEIFDNPDPAKPVRVRVATKPKVVAKPAPNKGCDADALKDKGAENVNDGNYTAALKQFEAALRCKDTDYVRQLAFIAACNGGNSAKANDYYLSLSPKDKNRLRPQCERNKINLTCDEGLFKDKGMENVNMGQHAAALAQFESSLRCKSDSYVLQLAFMAACNGGNSAKAKYYYPKMTGGQQQRFKVMCIRNSVKFE